MADPVVLNDLDVPDPSVADPAEAAVRPAVFEALLDEFPVALGDTERAHYMSLTDPEKAYREGASAAAPVVLADLVHAARTALPSVLAGKIGGYGPLRLRFAVELGRDLARMLIDRDGARIDAAGMRGARRARLSDTRVLRRQALRALKNLAGPEDDERDRVREAAGTAKAQADERARSLENIAVELASKVAEMPETVAKDAGATLELLTKLRSGAKAVLDTRDGAVTARDDLTGRTSAMHVLGGRILREMRLLTGAVRDTRIADPTVPVLRLRSLVRRSKAKNAEAPALKSTKAPARKPAKAPARKPAKAPARKSAKAPARKPAKAPARKPGKRVPAKG